MGWLSGAVDDGRWTHLLDQPDDTRAVANVELMMNKPGHFADQSLLIEASVALRSEDHSSLIIVDAVDREPARAEERTGLRADET